MGDDVLQEVLLLEQQLRAELDAEAARQEEALAAFSAETELLLQREEERLGEERGAVLARAQTDAAESAAAELERARQRAAMFDALPDAALQAVLRRLLPRLLPGGER